MKLIRTIYLHPAQDVALDELHRETRVPKSEYIREGIDLILEKHKRLIEPPAEPPAEGAV